MLKNPWRRVARYVSVFASVGHHDAIHLMVMGRASIPRSGWRISVLGEPADSGDAARLKDAVRAAEASAATIDMAEVDGRGPRCMIVGSDDKRMYHG
jgi:hypothetical protein